MKHLTFSADFARILVCAIAIMLVGAILSAKALGFADASTENGPLEWTQEVFLLVAAVFSVGSMVSLRKAERLAAFLATVLYVVFLLRELELPPIGPITRYLGSHAFRWHEMVAVVLITVPYLVARRHCLREIAAYGLSFRGWPFAVAAGFVFLGAYFDGSPMFDGIAYLGTFLEETAELLGYGVLAVAAAWVLCQSRRTEDEAVDLAILPRSSVG
ncbi:hypothetical protein [Aureimonas sp. ME7]|uniref:hypothetical protein n=1 Tax=Aureimonas sp. ME7 TaxID=2744252 RepID=UPI0015F4D86E|nr:hypothetical protein [Aureimonas sp. ME7]